MSNNTKSRISDVYELTPLQQGILFHTLYDRNHLTYFIQVRYSLRGALDVSLFERSFNNLFDRHSILRTSFVYRGLKQPLQVVLKDRKVDFHYRDIQEMNQTEQQSFLYQYIEADRSKPFDLTQDVLMRVAVIKIAEFQYEFIWTKHHILLDGWSSSILISDLLTTYYTYLSGQVPHLTQVRPYSNYISYLKGQDREVPRFFFQEYLAGYEQSVSFNSNRLHNVRGDIAKTNSVEYLLDEQATSALREVGRKFDVTLNAVFNAIWSILLSKLNNVRDVVYGVVVSGRPSNVEGIEDMVGLFINTLPIRVKYETDTTFVDLMKNISDSFFQINQHSSYALADILAENPLKNSLFDHIIGFENFPVSDRIRGASKPWENLVGREKIIAVSGIVNYESSNYGLNVVVNASEKLSVQLEFDQNLYSKDYLKSLLGYFDNVVRQILSEPSTVISKISLLSAREVNELAVPFRIDLDKYPINVTLHQAFERQVSETPDSIALLSNDVSLTYDGLNKIVNQFSRYINQQLQLSPRQIVAVMLPRSEKAVIALLSIIKSGCVFLSIDPKYPKERKKFILEDARPSALITDSTQFFDMDFYTGPLCAIDIELQNSESLDFDNVEVLVNESDLAYIVYTSGSTGQPKGVMIEHRSTMNMALNLVERFGLLPSDRVLQFASLSFDGVVAEIFIALLKGAGLVVVEEEDIKDGIKFIGQIICHNVSVAILPPAYLSAIDIDKLHLRVIVTAGEAMNSRDAQRCKLSSEVYNGYGPTECAVAATVYKVSDEDFSRPTMPIGSALANTRIYILDDNMNPVPHGVTGEICISGVGVARGYLNRPQLTEERFVKDPFVDENRMYRTGDLGRYINDKDIEFIGRKDNQVKVRGFRIELEEIESVLKQHALVENAKVYVNTINGTKDVCAIIVPSDSGMFRIRNLMKLRRLPELRQSLFQLPNGLSVFHKNVGETVAIYEEIFESADYFRNGITLKSGDVVFDVGANIGFFSLFVGLSATASRIYAFEPIKQIFDVLEANAQLYNINLQTFNYGVGERDDLVEFTYYPHNTAISGRYADANEDSLTVQSFMLGELSEQQRPLIDAVVKSRMRGETQSCRIRRLSDIISENHIDKIDLLKIDVEKSEFDVLKGINEEDWPKIKQIVMEVHGDRVGELSSLLKQYGFSITSGQPGSLKTTKLFNIYASRSGNLNEQSVPVPVVPDFSNLNQFVEVIKTYCKSVMPEYMIPSQFRVIESIPLTVNGKIDLSSLLDSESVATSAKNKAREPKNLIESQLMVIFADILNYKDVCVDDHFFERGGHSIKAIQLISRISKDFNVDVDLNDIFENAVLKDIASIVSSKEQTENRQIPIAGVQEHYALSFAQRRLWIVHQFADLRNAYVILRRYKLQGSLDVGCLEAAFKELYERHEILRTAFALVENEPRQFIMSMDSAVINFQYRDLRNIVTSEMVEEIQASSLEKTCNLQRGGLMAADILQISDDEFIFLFSIHHIICDGWSINILVQELLNSYSNLLENKQLKQALAKIQYKDYSEWQNGLLKGKYLKDLESYWKHRLRGYETLKIPLDFPRSSSADFSGASVDFTLDDKVMRDIKMIALAEKTTVNTVLMSIYFILLSRLSSQQDIIIGTSLLGRNHDELEHAVGFFINTIVLRNKVYPELKFVDFLKVIHTSYLEDMKRQDMPFDLLVETLDAKRSSASTPIFQARFVYSDLSFEHSGDTFLPNVKIVPEQIDEVVSKFDLSLTMYPDNEAVGGHLEYRTALFKKSSVESFVSVYTSFVAEVAANPLIQIADLKFDAVTKVSVGHVKNQLGKVKLFPIKL
jgi:amino acid adenylation domain-containing protein/FkbM family methyltransferase